MSNGARFNEPETIIQYANGLISFKQYQELMVDLREAGGDNITIPKRGVYWLDDQRIEIQVLGNVALPE